MTFTVFKSWVTKGSLRSPSSLSSSFPSTILPSLLVPSSSAHQPNESHSSFSSSLESPPTPYLPSFTPRATRLRCAVYKPHPTCNGTFFNLFSGKIRYIHASCPWRPLVQLGSSYQRERNHLVSTSTPANDTKLIQYKIFSIFSLEWKLYVL